jgi:hypothetical protein
MTKTEKAQLASLEATIEQLAREVMLERAMRRTAVVKPDLPPPRPGWTGMILTKGWMFNSYADEVGKACSSSVHHSLHGWDKTTSQRPLHLYSTELLALQALRHEAGEQSARRLAAIDKRIAEAGTPRRYPEAAEEPEGVDPNVKPSGVKS